MCLYTFIHLNSKIIVDWALRFFGETKKQLVNKVFIK